LTLRSEEKLLTPEENTPRGHLLPFPHFLHNAPEEEMNDDFFNDSTSLISQSNPILSPRINRHTSNINATSSRSFLQSPPYTSKKKILRDEEDDEYDEESVICDHSYSQLSLLDVRDSREFEREAYPINIHVTILRN
jgi:hypothetical protein